MEPSRWAWQLPDSFAPTWPAHPPQGTPPDPEPSLPPPPKCFLVMKAYWGHSQPQLIRKEMTAPR